MGSCSIVTIPQRVWTDLKRHVLDEAPREAVGMVGMHNDEMRMPLRTRNVSEDPITSFVMHGMDQVKVTNEIQRAGLSATCIYHSHPMALAVLSADDLKFAQPDYLYMVIGMRHGIEAKAWEISQKGTMMVRLVIT